MNGAVQIDDADKLPPIEWFVGAVNTAYVYGLISGYDDDTFRPNAKITREQAMAMIAEALAIAGLKDKLPA